MTFRSFCNIDALDKKGIVLLAFVIILYLGIDLRFYNLNKVYTEYDDIGVLALHKGVVSNREGEIDFWFFKKTFSFSKETLQELERTYLFPIYIAWGWTYSPGQYLIYPMMLSDNDSYDTKVFKGRFVSMVSSVLTILLLCWVFVKINNGLNWTVLFPLAIFSFSQNSIFYAHHMGPYSMYGLSTVLGLILVYQVHENKISTYTGCLLNTSLLYFSYLNVLIFVPLLAVEFERKNLQSFLLSYFSEKKYLLFFNILLIMPVLVILSIKTIAYKISRVNQTSDFMSIVNIPVDILRHLLVASQSVFTGLFSASYPFLTVVLLLVTFFGVIFMVVLKTPLVHKIILIGLVLYLFQWVVLYMMSKLPLTPTRHALIFFPIILSMCFIFFNYLKIPNTVYLFLFVTAIPYSYLESKNMIDQKTNKLNFEFIEKEAIKHVFLYDSTLSPLLYFEGKKKVVNVDMNSFISIYKDFKMPETFLLVSQAQPLKLYTPVLKKRFPEIFSEYKSETLVENTTGQYFTYNNYRENSTQNGFYVYRFTKIDSFQITDRQSAYDIN
jgi:hypothetical protein